ncbi:hypothetical protein ASG39_22700 [Rhizobium sp. Leaf371]|uniref:hypothetical protein n=1 Tax=Rhizobium sp. Leaf371 TaxID=1736355 RepID=UPI0007154AE3|nr:hypothetical protein [Rhizobium sp. Leaf371]KQS67655.1 hypothetical protein ASG39_22700 [Rhizobium sp. Leaf371]
MENTTDKQEKFKELAKKRTINAIESIQKIGGLSNKKTYAWDEKDVAKIVKALRSAVSDMEREFGAKTNKKQTFDF